MNQQYLTLLFTNEPINYLKYDLQIYFIVVNIKGIVGYILKDIKTQKAIQYRLEYNYIYYQRINLIINDKSQALLNCKHKVDFIRFICEEVLKGNKIYLVDLIKKEIVNI